MAQEEWTLRGREQMSVQSRRRRAVSRHAEQARYGDSSMRMADKGKAMSFNLQK